MTLHVRLPSDLLATMRDNLAQDNPYGGERVGFLGADSTQWLDRADVYARTFQPVTPGGYLPSGPGAVVIGTPAIRSAIQFAMSEEIGVWHVHMHPWRGTPRPSHTDLAEIPRVLQAFHYAAPEYVHGMLIISPDSASAFAWIPTANKLQPADNIVEVGWPMKFMVHRQQRARNRSQRYVRQSYLGDSAQDLLAGATVGVVGASGGGSHIVQQLAHAGITSLRTFDPQTFEESNLNRCVGATAADVVAVTPKVSIGERIARGVDPTAEYRGFQARWQDHPEVLRQCDVVVGCVDTFVERRELEVFCRRFLIPYVDIGTDVHLRDGEAPRSAGQLIVSLPGGPCMTCLGFLTEARLGAEARAYGAGEGASQVVWQNGVLASTAVGFVIELLTGWTEHSRRGRYLSYDGNRGLLSEHPMWSMAEHSECQHFPLDRSGLPGFMPL